MIHEFLCWVGIHVWAKVAAYRPTRACIHCTQKQACFRGSGADSWDNIE